MGNIGEFDARYSEEDEENWIETTSTFLVSAHMMNLIAFQGRLRSQSDRLFKTVDACKHILNQSWNSKLPKCPKYHGRKQARAKKSKKEGIYVEVSPPEKLRTEQKIKCHKDNCTVLFSSQRAAKLHLKRKHPEDLDILTQTIGKAAANPKDKVRKQKFNSCTICF